MAEDKGAEPLRNTTTVVVNVEDTNDNVPMFTESSYSTTVREGLTTLPLTIPNLQYIDGDSTEAFRRSHFSITSVHGPEGEAGTIILALSPGLLPNFLILHTKSWEVGLGTRLQPYYIDVNLSYHCSPNTVDTDLFSVSTNADDVSGTVILNRPVDYELYTSYRVSLSVTNDADLSSSLCTPNEIRE